MSFFAKKSKSIFKPYLCFFLGVSILMPTFVYAYKIVGDSTFRVTPSNQTSTSSNFQVRDTLRVEPRRVIISQNFKAPRVVVAVNTPDGSEKYDASEWLLARTYDELVRAREADGPFLASAPEQTRVTREDPVLNQESPVVVSNVPEPLFEEQDLIDSDPVETKSVVLKRPSTISRERGTSSRVVVTKKLYTASDLPVGAGSFKMSAPSEQEGRPSISDSCSDKYVYFAPDSPWKWLAEKMFFFIQCLLIVIYLLVVLVLLMVIRRKKAGKGKSIRSIYGEIKKLMF